MIYLATISMRNKIYICEDCAIALHTRERARIYGGAPYTRCMKPNCNKRASYNVITELPIQIMAGRFKQSI